MPHPIPYQGSKRRLAAAILRFTPKNVDRLIEPFAGSAAITLAAATRGLARRYVVGERLEPLARLWQLIVGEPDVAADRYEKVWIAQLGNPREHFLEVREEFNRTGDPVLLLFLVARCVKNAIRFNPSGKFNQSPDHRRTGMRPERMRLEMLRASGLLRGRFKALATDYRSLLRRATARDLVYMDPPYQGVSEGRDSRYFEQLDLQPFLNELKSLNKRSVPYLLSFDGSCGGREYGSALPKELRLRRIIIEVGRSSQATLNGRSDVTCESLYVSPALASDLDEIPSRIMLDYRIKQQNLFA